jgi:FkbM family methyltransferase
VIQRKNLTGRVVPIQSAVGSSEGQIQFWHNEAHSGDHRVITEQFAAAVPDAAQISAIPLTGVDAFACSRNLGKIAFIKIDVQGYEPVVCQGMKRTIVDSPDVCICCEYDPQAMIELGFQPDELLEFFYSSGFQIYTLDRTSLAPASDPSEIQRLAAEVGYVDLLCVRRPLK